jgi:acyl carrier protein
MATTLKPAQSVDMPTPTESIIRDFILQDILYDKQLSELGSEDSLLESELLDSIAIMQVVAFCEQIFDINIPEEELLPEHFENVRAIAQMVQRHLARKPA